MQSQGWEVVPAGSSWLFLPCCPLGSQFQCPPAHHSLCVCLVVLFELVLLCLLLKLKERDRKEICYQWFCRIVFGGLCLGHVGNLRASQGPSVGRALEDFRSSQ